MIVPEPRKPLDPALNPALRLSNEFGKGITRRIA